MIPATTAVGRTLLAAPHVVEFSRTGYGLQHPIACRPNLIGCPMNRWLAAQDGPAAKPGKYLMAGPGQFERLPKGWIDPLVPDAIAAIEAESRANLLREITAEVETQVTVDHAGRPNQYVIGFAEAVAEVLARLDAKGGAS